MRQPRKRITNAVKAMTPRIVPPMAVPVSTEVVVSPVIIRLVKSAWLYVFGFQYGVLLGECRTLWGECEQAMHCMWH